MPSFAANGIDIYYERMGEGPPLLICNGSGATIETSRPLVDVFATQFDVAVHDQRGLGRTTVPDEPFTMAEYAADAIAVLDELGWDTCRVVGVSFGGMVAQELAVTVPERIERLALACTSPGGEGGSSFPLHELQSLPAEERAERGLAILDTRFSPAWFEDHPADRGFADLAARQAGDDKSEDRRRGERGQLEARSHHDVCDRLPRIACPVLVASGRFDGIAPVANGSFIAEHIGSNAELRTYEGGHLFFLQDKAALPEILTFLS